jgi:hypothetical protein
MTHRLLTIWFPILSLAVAMILVTHDAGMAAGFRHPGDHHPAAGRHAAHPSPDHETPRHSAAHAPASHEAPAHDATHDAPTEQEFTCVSFEAARTTERLPDPGAVALISIPFAAVPDVTAHAGWVSEVDPGAPPEHARALLQVWLI